MRISRVVAVALLSVAAAAFMACQGTGANPGDATPVVGDGPELVEVTAPIESIAVSTGESSPPQYFLVVKSGLPNGCVKPGNYGVARSGETVDVTVTVLAPAAGSLVACTEAYTVVEKTVALGSDFKPGTTYTVNVNDKRTTFTTEDAAAQEPEAIEAPAPIDALTVNVAESLPPRYMLVVESGLPNGCARFGGYDVARDGDTVTVSVTNLMPADPNTACTAVYGSVETTVALGSDYEPGTTYTVLVNGKSTTFTAQGKAAQTVEEDAPIEGAAIEYAPDGGSRLVLTTGLTSGCQEAGKPVVIRDGDTILVEAQNLVQVGAACTDDYRTVEARLAVPGDIEACASYNVIVNGEARPVQATAPSIRCKAPEPVATPAGDEKAKTASTTDGSAPGEQSNRTEVKIDIGDTVDGGSKELRIGFLDVTEDSRCPAKVTCVWEGRAVVLLGVVAGESMPTFHEVVFGGGAEGQGKVQAGEYTIEIVALDPYPGTVELAEGERPAYVVTVLVGKGSAD